MVFVKNIPVECSKKDILRYLGFKPRKSEKSQFIDSLVEEAIDAARLILEPAALFETLNIERVYPNKIVFSGTGLELLGSGIAEFMSPCSKVSLVAATIGANIDREIERLFSEQDSSRAVVLDAVGSDAVEQVVSWVDTLVRREAEKQGFRTLHRVSPGYPLWAVEGNRHIGEALKAEKIGIEVLPSCQLLPRKSVFAAIGWVPKDV